MSMTKIPQNIGGFEILGTLGQGGMGVVYCVRDHTLGRDLAVKLQTGDWKHSPERLVRFLREARILANINHPNVVQIYSVGEHEGAPFFAMELLESSIADAVRLKMPGIAQVKRWMMEAARGLAAIHEKGVVHRDIKPGNLLLTRPTSLEEEHVKVADLGIATAGDHFGVSLTRAGAVLGTSGYLPPEAFRGGTLDSRADQYSLGVVFFELLAKRPPYADMSDSAQLTAIRDTRSPPDVREFRPEIDAATAQIVSRMLSDDPDDRFDSTQSLVQALSFIQGNEGRALPASLDAPPRQRAATHSSPPEPAVARDAATASRAPATAASRGGWIRGLSAGALLIFAAGAGYWISTRPRPTALATPPVAAEPAASTAVESKSATEPVSEQPLPTTAAEPESVGASLPAAKPSPASSAVSPTVIDPKLRIAWAKYVLDEYTLTPRANEEVSWTLALQTQKQGLIQGVLTGPEPTPIQLTGMVESQSTETIDGEDWDIYTLNLKDAAGRVVDLRFEFTEEETAGEGSLLYQGHRRRFDVVDSEE
ncbi:MAG: serine/threonine protein kinase [Lysobacterales bacterium]